MPACRAHRHAPGWLLDFSFQCPPRTGPTWLRRAEKREANQWLMSSVLNWPSHEVWRETSKERANWPWTAKASQEPWTEKVAVIGLLSAARSRGECSHRREWRRIGNPNPTFSEFLAFPLPAKGPVETRCQIAHTRAPLSGFMGSRFQRQFLLLSRHARASVHVETVIAEVMQPEKENGDGKHAPR
jgi:hypothetical protein